MQTESMASPGEGDTRGIRTANPLGEKTITVIIPMLRTVLFLCASAGVAFAQVDDILANTGSFRPKVTVSDVYTERVVADVEDDFIYRSVEANPERIAVSIIANIDGADTGVIDESTVVGVTAGNFDHSGALGDSIDYKPGLKRATFPLTTAVDLPNGDTREVRVGTVTYVWTAKTLTITVTCTDIAAAGVGDIAASNYVGTADPGTSVTFVDDESDVTVNFGDATGNRRIFLDGITKTVTQHFGSVSAGTFEEFDLSNVTLTGTADVKGPVVKPLFPLKPNALNKLDITGTATDTQEITLTSVMVNNVETPAASAAVTDEDANGVWNWNVAGLPLKKGANAVVLVFEDADGNATKVTRTYTVR